MRAKQGGAKLLSLKRPAHEIEGTSIRTEEWPSAMDSSNDEVGTGKSGSSGNTKEERKQNTAREEGKTKGSAHKSRPVG